MEPPEPRGLPRNLVTALFHPWTWKMAWRDSRARRLRLVIFALAIVAGIGSLVAIHSLKATVETGVATQAKALLGSDLMISSRRAIPDAAVTELSRLATRTGGETSFSSMLSRPENGVARLVQVRALDGGYPFYGKVETTPADAWDRLQREPGILVEPALLDQFQVKPGDRMKLGAIELPVLGVVDKPAPRSGRFSAFAPEIYVRPADLAATGLLGANSLSSHAVHLQLPPGADGKELKRTLRDRFPEEPWRIETPEDRRETLGNALDQFQRFLGILALASLVLGAIGVAAAVHAHISRRTTTVAILRCLGCPGHLAFAVYLAQAAALGLLGAILGAALGVGLQTLALSLFRGSLPVDIGVSPEWPVVLRTTAAGFAVCCGFALLPLLRIQRVSPAATLREGASLNPGSAWWRAWPVYLLLTAMLVLLAVLNDPSWKRALAFTGGLATAFLVLLGVARGLISATRRFVRPGWPYLLRQGLSNLHRPHNQTMLFLLSLGLGAFLMVTVLLAKNLVTARLTLTQFAESPTLYLVDVQPDQVEGVGTLLREHDLPRIESAPMVTMRIQSIRGVPVRDLEKQKTAPRWVIRREFRSTYRDHLNPTETIVAGEWLTKVPDPAGPVPLSLEEEIAKDLNVTVGDEMIIDVQGVPVNAKVTSLRKVDWSRFNLNFFMVFPPGVLEDAPGFHVVTTRVSEGVSSGDFQRDLAQRFPNVSAIDLTLILNTVRGILSKISAVVSVLAGCTLLAALPILIGTLLNGRDLRLRESVLLRVLGASSRQVRIILFIEHAALGALSALAGLILAVAANAVLAIYLFKESPWPDPVLLVSAFGITTGIAVLGGLLLSRGVCNHPPLAILRSGN